MEVARRISNPNLIRLHSTPSLTNTNMHHFPTRQDMLASLPKGLVIAELGVFKGDFAQDILNICCPSRLYLVDTWANAPIKSGNQDGNNIETHSGKFLLKHVKSRFKDNNTVVIIQGNRHALSGISLDAIYIDANHNETSVFNDLTMSYNIVKYGGYIMGHDYDTNEKHSNKLEFGVKKAVTKFCQQYNLQVDGLAEDGCRSFLIRR